MNHAVVVTQRPRRGEKKKVLHTRANTTPQVHRTQNEVSPGSSLMLSIWELYCERANFEREKAILGVPSPRLGVKINECHMPLKSSLGVIRGDLKKGLSCGERHTTHACPEKSLR